MKTHLLALLGAASLSACAIAPQHPALHAAEQSATSVAARSAPAALPPLVPARAYVADWDGNGGYQISPDGQRLMWSARKGLNQGLFVKELATGTVHSYSVPALGQWAQDSRHILLHMDSGDENSSVFLLDSFQDSTTLKNLTPFPGARSSVHSTIEGSADLLISSNRRDPKVFDLYRYRFESSQMELMAQNPGTVALWLTDRQANLVGRASKEGGNWVFETPASPQAGAPWQRAFTVSAQDVVVPLEVSAATHQAWALSNRGRDKVALVQIDLRNGEEKVFYQDERADIDRAYISRQSGTPLAVSVQPGMQEWKIFDARLAPTAARLTGAHTRQWDMLSLSRDEQWLTAVVQDEQGGRSVLVNLASGESTVLGELSSSRIHAMSPLPQRRAIALTSRDGLPLSGYVTVPVDAAGQPLRALPTVVLVHGGPWARDAWGDRNLPLFLANRGYAVLQVNYRGSTGFGKAFEHAAKGEFAGKMHTDLLDGLTEITRLGVADPSKVAIVGGSYGGYASLVGMTHTPGRFACAVSLNGVTDLPSLIADFPPYWDLFKDRWYSFAGNPALANDLQSLRDKSPLTHVDRVQGPVLVMQGTLDARVQRNQALHMVQALRQADKTVEYVELAKAGHGLQRWPDRLTFYRKTEDFLARCLGGRSAGWDFFELGGVLF